MIEIKAPNDISNITFQSKTLFTAGSIKMGAAIDWQKEFIEKLRNTNFVILNPRRDDWDSSWEQKITNRKFYQQVNWELSGLEIADYVFFYFASEGISPISLLEFGLVASRTRFYNTKIVVCCEENYFRKGNVDIVARRYNCKSVKTIDDAVNYFLIENERNNGKLLER